MTECEYNTTWYHGSPYELATIRKGSWITQSKEMAKAFSHKPTLMSMSDDLKTVKHNGTLPGFLYRVAEEIGPEDVTLLPGTEQTHWSANRELSVALIEEVPLLESEILTDEEIAQIRKHRPGAGRDTFFQHSSKGNVT